jgi:subtilase family serine protease
MLRSAYSLPTGGSKRETVAVIGAYDDSHLQSDMAVYTKRFHLPACTVRNRCLRVINEAGQGSPLPPPDPTGGTWNVEHALSAEVVHAICQNCSILVVDGSSDSNYDLSTAVDAAAKAHARVIVTTFGPAQTYTDSQYASDYANPGAIVVAAAGDSGYTGSVDFPSTFPNVLAVGGTHLELGSRGRYLRETAWSMGTSGCSSYMAAARWQQAQASSVGCGKNRAVVDVSAVADPGAIVYITGGGSTPGGAWYEVGGTSLSAPIIGGVFGLAGGGGSSALSHLYRVAHTHPSAFHDVRSGTNSSSCGGKPICSARRGYDGPTGLGTPSGLAAFKP